MHGIHIYLKLIRLSIQSRMSYKTDFFSGVVGVIIFNTINICTIGIIASKFTVINGWNVWELVFLYSMWLLSHSFNSLFFWHFTSLEHYLREGTFDQFLVRPFSPLIQFLGREIQYMGIGDVVISIAGIVIAYSNLALSWEEEQWFFFFLAILAGIFIEMAICWIIASISFWTVRTHSVFQVLWQINSIVQQYPVDIFGKWFRIVVTAILPVAFINYYPSMYLLSKNLHDPDFWMSLLSPFVAVFLLGIALMLWRLGIKKYSSTGS